MLLFSQDEKDSLARTEICHVVDGDMATRVDVYELRIHFTEKVYSISS